MRAMVPIVLAVLLMGCIGMNEKSYETTIVPTTPNETTSNFMPYFKQAVVMKIGDKYKVMVFFELPTPCHKIKFEGMKIQNNTITIDFRYTPPKPNETCIQVLQEFNETIDIGRLDKGNYKIIIRVNGIVVKDISFDVR